MSDIWFRRLGFYNNPFNIKPAAFHDRLTAYDMDYIYDKIDKGLMLFIEGEFGTGKTTMLKNIINRYRGNRRVIYYNFNKAQEDLNATKLIERASPFYKRMLGLGPKNVVLLLDEVHHIKAKLGRRLYKYYNDGVIQSIIFVNIDYGKVKLPKCLREMVEENIISTPTLSMKEAISLVRDRIGNIELLSDEKISEIFRLSGKNPRKFLENCEDICRVAVESDSMTVRDEHIKTIVPPQKKVAKKKKGKKKPVSEPEVERKEFDSRQAPVESAKAEDKEIPEYQVVFYDNKD